MRTVILAGGLGSRLGEETAVRPRENRAEDGGQINGGFFVAQPSLLELIKGPDSVRGCGPLEQLAAHREPRGYQHEGF
jgi:glucose-1-phosphate cytidylyltransferase